MNMWDPCLIVCWLGPPKYWEEKHRKQRKAKQHMVQRLPVKRLVGTDMEERDMCPYYTLGRLRNEDK
jgi:hypothetical protein